MNKKKIATTLLTLIILFLVLTIYKPVYSQQEQEEFNFDKAYKDYIFTHEVYEKAHSDYLLARAQYLQAKTLLAQNKAKEETIKMLQARDDVLRTYLTALRLKLQESQGISETTKQGLLSRIDNEVLWYSEHKSSVSSAGTLEDMVNDSTEAANHFTNSTESLVYEVLSTIALGKVSILRDELNQTLNSTKNKLEEIRQNQDHDVSASERWILEIENKITRSLDKQIEAQSLVFNLNAQTREPRNTQYNTIITRLTESLQFLREASSFLKEVIRQIKTKN